MTDEVAETGFGLELDEMTLKALRRGNRRARERVYRLYSQPAWNLALRLTGCEARAADAVQDAFVRSFTRLDRFPGPSGFGFWFRRILINLVIDQQRRRSREVGPEPINEIQSDDRRRQDLRADLEQALSTLDPVDRRVIWLYDVQGMTHVEIAELHGQTPSWSKSRVSRARSRLREWLDRAPTAGTAREGQ